MFLLMLFFNFIYSDFLSLNFKNFDFVQSIHRYYHEDLKAKVRVQSVCKLFL